MTCWWPHCCRYMIVSLRFIRISRNFGVYPRHVRCRENGIIRASWGICGSTRPISWLSGRSRLLVSVLRGVSANLVAIGESPCDESVDIALRQLEVKLTTVEEWVTTPIRANCLQRLKRCRRGEIRSVFRRIYWLFNSNIPGNFLDIVWSYLRYQEVWNERSKYVRSSNPEMTAKNPLSCSITSSWAPHLSEPHAGYAQNFFVKLLEQSKNLPTPKQWRSRERCFSYTSTLAAIPRRAQIVSFVPGDS